MSEVENQIFREKSIKNISSPEQLNDYVRVTTPGVWVIMAAIIVLLVGACVWGIFGHLETWVPACAVVEDGKVTCYIKENNADNVKPGQKIVVEGVHAVISSVSEEPEEIDQSFNSFALHVGGLDYGDWVYSVKAEGDVPDGVYMAEIVVDTVRPISFLIN